MTRGRLITIEGGEGAGKSTQVPLLVAALENAGITALATREPGGSPGAEAIRKLLLESGGGCWDAVAEALLLTAARRDHVVRLIEPALARGQLQEPNLPTVGLHMVNLDAYARRYFRGGGYRGRSGRNFLLCYFRRARSIWPLGCCGGRRFLTPKRFSMA
jgi:hypothetical protein